jgi:hypothetical protein
VAASLLGEEGIALCSAERLRLSDSVFSSTTAHGVFVGRAVGFGGKSGNAHPAKASPPTKLLGHASPEQSSE